MTNRWYVGIKNGHYDAFQSGVIPTAETHGDRYLAVIGPFQTKRGAMWAEKYGPGNPHFQTVADAERLSKQTNRNPRRSLLAAHANALLPTRTVTERGARRVMPRSAKRGVGIRSAKRGVSRNPNSGYIREQEMASSTRANKFGLQIYRDSTRKWFTLGGEYFDKDEAIRGGKELHKSFPQFRMRVIEL